MELLEPVTQPYAWGSRTAIAELQGRRFPTAQPEAELWMGAHPSAPSGVALPGGGHTTLDAMIAANPVRELGAECVARFGGRLPFLLKVLAAETALSIQVHPSRLQAEAGFRAENERGRAPGDKSHNYARRLAQAGDPVRAHAVRGAGRDARPAGRGRTAERARGRRA